MRPREYQEYAIQSLFAFFMGNATGNPVIVMPTGTGKSIVIGGFIWQVMATWPTQRIMMLTHVKELIAQNADKLNRMWPAAPLGIYSAGLKTKQAFYPITFAGIQSVVKLAPMFGHVDIVIIDECHTVSPNEDTSYQTFIDGLRQVNPNLKVIGLSATPYRLGLGMITEGGIFTDVACDMSTVDAFNWFIDEGFLIPLIPRPTKTELDISDVKKRGGEFIDKDLQRAVDKVEITEAALREAMEIAHDRNRILVFTTGVEHTEHVTEALRLLGETAVCVHSKMSDADRGAALKAHRSGEARWMVNNNVLTTGYDDPEIDCEVMLRPTNSPGLWVQMLGRGTRPFYAPGFDLDTTEGRLASIAASIKKNCMVLDFAGNTMRLGPINDPVIPKMKGKGGGPPPVKFCENQNTQNFLTDKTITDEQRKVFHMLYEQVLGEWQVTGCGAFNHTSARTCCNCGAEFIFRPKFTDQASTNELIRKKKHDEQHEEGPQVETFKVDRVVYAVHEKAGGSPSMKVTYHCGLRSFSEWVPAWHPGNVSHKGKKWWEERTDLPVPMTPEDAVEQSDELMVPSAIRVWINKKYPEVLGHEWQSISVNGDSEGGADPG